MWLIVEKGQGLPRRLAQGSSTSVRTDPIGPSGTPAAEAQDEADVETPARPSRKVMRLCIVLLREDVVGETMEDSLPVRGTTSPCPGGTGTGEPSRSTSSREGPWFLEDADDRDA
jgi:hypothetical protein